MKIVNSISFKRNLVSNLIYWLFVYECISCFLQKNFGFPKSIMFGIDIVYIILLIKVFLTRPNSRMAIPTAILVLLFFSVVLGMVLNGSEISNFIWGARSEFLCMTVLYASIKYLVFDDIERIMRFFFKFQFLNLVCAAYQYHVLGYFQDLNNGAFIGGAYQNVFCAILFSYYFYKYINHEDKLWKLVFVCISSLYIAVVEEEKFIFIEFAGIIAYYFVSSGMNLKKYLIMIGCAFAGFVTLPLLNAVNGQVSMEMLTSWDSFIEYATMVGYGYELPRIGSSIVISSLFLTTPIREFFGLGLGMCEDASTISFIDTSFYQQWSWLHYEWFTFQIQFMQTGWIGMILYISFFISLLCVNFRCRKLMPDKYKYLSDFSITLTFISIAVIWYSMSTRGYAGNFIYFSIAVGVATCNQLVKQSKISKK